MLRNLKKIRIGKGFTLKELSGKTNISTTYLSDLENLNRKSPSYKIMDQLTKVLNTTIEELEGKY